MFGRRIRSQSSLTQIYLAQSLPGYRIYRVYFCILDQGCRSCSILPSRMGLGEHGVSLENMEKMENVNQMTQNSPEYF